MSQPPDRRGNERRSEMKMCMDHWAQLRADVSKFGLEVFG